VAPDSVPDVALGADPDVVPDVDYGAVHGVLSTTLE
jgi:hypothetical protein